MSTSPSWTTTASSTLRMSLPLAIPSLSWSPTSTSRAASTCPARMPSPLSPRSAPRPPSSDYGGFVPSLQRRNRRNSKQIKQERESAVNRQTPFLICLHCRGRACPDREFTPVPYLWSALWGGVLTPPQEPGGCRSLPGAVKTAPYKRRHICRLYHKKEAAAQG